MERGRGDRALAEPGTGVALPLSLHMDTYLAAVMTAWIKSEGHTREKGSYPPPLSSLYVGWGADTILTFIPYSYNFFFL